MGGAKEHQPLKPWGVGVGSKGPEGCGYRQNLGERRKSKGPSRVEEQRCAWSMVRLQGAQVGGADELCLQEAYESVVEYFGENPKTTSPSMFFSLFSRFTKAYKVQVSAGWGAGSRASQ